MKRFNRLAMVCATFMTISSFLVACGGGGSSGPQGVRCSTDIETNAFELPAETAEKVSLSNKSENDQPASAAGQYTYLTSELIFVDKKSDTSIQVARSIDKNGAEVISTVCVKGVKPGMEIPETKVSGITAMTMSADGQINYEAGEITLSFKDSELKRSFQKVETQNKSVKEFLNSIGTPNTQFYKVASPSEATGDFQLRTYGEQGDLRVYFISKFKYAELPPVAPAKGSDVHP